MPMLHSLCRNVTLSLVLLIAGPTLAGGADWPHFRGPEHGGVSQETGWKGDWPEAGPPIAWKKNIGIGFASMSVADDRLYAMGNQNGEEIVWCFEAATGEQIWTHKYPGKLVNRMHEGGPGSTPTVHEGQVHTLGREGQVYCFDAATGKVIWQADLQKELGIEVPAWGFTSSGLIEGNAVIYQAGATIAFDRNTGKVLWKSKAYEPAYSTPVPFTIGDRRALAVLNSFGLVILDPRTGEEIAATEWDARFDTNAASPIIVGDRIFLTAGYRKGAALYQLKGNQLQQLWDSDAMSNHMNSSVLVDGKLYGFNGNSTPSRAAQLVCMDYNTGEVHWKRRGLGCGSLISADGKLIVLSDAGELVTLKATPADYQEISRAKVLDGKCWTHPVLSHGRIYARDAMGELVCVDVRGE